MLLGVLSMTQAQQLTPECYVDIEPNRYIVHFTLPQYSLEYEDGNDYDTELNYGEYGTCDDFTNIIITDESDYDMTDIPGYPELPFFSLNLLLPNDAQNIQITYVKQDSTQETLSYYITPAYRGNTIVNYGNSDTCISMDTECYSSEYYTYGCDQWYPNGFYNDLYTISPIYSLVGATGITFSIFPFSYHPHLGYMDVLLEGDFYIEFEGSTIQSAMDDLIYREDYLALTALTYFDNYNNIHLSYTSNANYLIIASHSDMADILDEYVDYKLGQGYNVEVMYLDDYSAIGNSVMIDYLIQSNYYFDPDFVLLVGNLNDIPPHWNVSIPSDGPYHPLIGRWIVDGEYGYYPELERIIDKTMDSEGYYTPSRSKASLFSGVDSKSRLQSKRFYRRLSRIVDESLDPMGHQYALYDGRVGTIGFSSMAQDLQYNHPTMFIYGGHGYVIIDTINNIIKKTGISDSYRIFPNDYYNYLYSAHSINELHNGNPYPIGIGFACSLNTYDIVNSFGAQWVNSYNGGVSFYSASIESFSSSNDWLSRRMFRMFRKMTEQIGNFPLSLWIYCAETDYYIALQTGQRLSQIQKYNLIGDPTLFVFGMSSNGSINYPQLLSPQKFSQDIENMELKLLYYDIYSIDGIHLQSFSADDSIDKFKYSQGLYILKETYNNNSIKTSKFLKQ